jgi:hypothetical protein
MIELKDRKNKEKKRKEGGAEDTRRCGGYAERRKL